MSQGGLFDHVERNVETLAVLPDLARFDRFAVDTETDGLDFHNRPVGLSIGTPDGRQVYLAFGHEGGGNNCSLAQVQAWAKVELTRSTQKKIFFNQPFDHRMCAYAGIDIAGPMEDASTVSALLNERERSFSLDYLSKTYVGEGKDDSFLRDWITLNFGTKNWKDSIAKAPGDIVAPYACGDVDRTLRLYDIRRPLITEQGLEAIYAVETALLPLVVKMHLTGVRVDRDRAVAAKKQLMTELGKAKKRWEELMPGINPLSTDQLAPIFREHGWPIGETETGGDSITKKELEAAVKMEAGSEDLSAMSEVPGLTKSIRELEKFAGTFVENYVLANCQADGVIHGEFHPLSVEYKPGKKYGTVSGRFSSGGALNLQNFPGDQKPEMKKLIRGLFIPYHPDMDWLKADYSQIEYRVLAHYAGDPLMSAYNKNPDIDFHQMLTDLINNPICPRPRTKNVNFAIAFGSSVKTAAATAGISAEDMQEIFDTYHERTEGCIQRLSKKAKDRAKDRGYIVTWGGRRRRFLSREEAFKLGWSVKPWERYMETHKALNALIQGSAADLLKKSMIRVAEMVDWKNTFLHLTVHDELDFSIPKGAAGTKFRDDLRHAMEDWPMKVPIKVELERGATWGETTKIKRED